MDNDNYFLTQEGKLDDFGICGDTPMSELVHAGIKGMKWGVRRYQNPDGTLTPAGKKRYNKTLEKVRAEEKALREKAKAEKTTEATRSKIDKLNARVDAVNKKKQALKDGKKISDDKPKTEAEKEAEKKAYEEAKARAIKSGSATEILKYKGDLTPQEMQSVNTRLQWEQNMQSISAKEVAVGKSKTDQLFENIDKTTTRAVSLAKAWNMAANVANAFGGFDVPLPKIDTDIGKSNAGDRKTAKKEKKEAEQKAENAAKKRAKEEAQREEKQRERAEKRAKEEAENKSQEKANAKAEKQARKDAKKAEKEANKVYEGDVVGEGTSRAGKQKADTIIDVDWEDVTISNVPATTRSRGQAYIESMFTLPAPDDD